MGIVEEAIIRKDKDLLRSYVNDAINYYFTYEYPYVRLYVDGNICGYISFESHESTDTVLLLSPSSFRFEVDGSYEEYLDETANKIVDLLIEEYEKWQVIGIEYVDEAYLFHEGEVGEDGNN